MKLLVLGTVLIAMLFGSDGARAAEPSCNYEWVLINTDGSKPTADQYAEKSRREAECRKNQVDQKQREAEARLQKEIGERDDARRAEAEKREEAAEKAREREIDAAMKKQDEMLKGMGVTLPSGVDLGDDDGDDGDGQAAGDTEIDPIELQMYQQMVENGIAPGCKGKQDAALIACVDEVIDAEE